MAFLSEQARNRSRRAGGSGGGKAKSISLDRGLLQAQKNRGLYPYQYLNPAYEPYHTRDKDTYISVPKLLVEWKEVGDTEVHLDGRMYRTGDLILYMGETIKGYTTRSDKRKELIFSGHIYKVISGGSRTNKVVTVIPPGYKQGRRSRPPTQTIGIEEIRHISQKIEKKRLREVEESKVNNFLHDLVEERLGIDTYKQEDNRKVYILHRMATEPNILDIIEAEEKNPVAIVNDATLLEETFWAMWENDPLRLVQHQEKWAKA